MDEAPRAADPGGHLPPTGRAPRAAGHSELFSRILDAKARRSIDKDVNIKYKSLCIPPTKKPVFDQALIDEYQQAFIRERAASIDLERIKDAKAEAERKLKQATVSFQQLSAHQAALALGETHSPSPTPLYSETDVRAELSGLNQRLTSALIEADDARASLRVATQALHAASFASAVEQYEAARRELRDSYALVYALKSTLEQLKCPPPSFPLDFDQIVLPPAAHFHSPTPKWTHSVIRSSGALQRAQESIDEAMAGLVPTPRPRSFEEAMEIVEAAAPPPPPGSEPAVRESQSDPSTPTPTPTPDGLPLSKREAREAKERKRELDESFDLPIPDQKGAVA